MNELKAQEIAQTIYDGFRGFRSAFAALTADAQRRFEEARWAEVQSAGARRLKIYQEHVSLVMDRVPDLAPPKALDDKLSGWSSIKAAFVERIDGTPDARLAETFFNSVYREHTSDRSTDSSEMFLQSSTANVAPLTESLVREFRPHDGVVPMVKAMLLSFGFEIAWQNLDRDVANVLRSLVEERPEIDSAEDIVVEVVRMPFFRNKGAYLVGRLRHGDDTWPMALPVLRSSDGSLYVDTLICDEDELSVMFSFTRAYFFVDTEYPEALIEYLQSLLPNKKRSELYASIGLHKHGKTVFYRDFLQHLIQSNDEFIIAPGIKGMVMAVFLLPSYQTVFKVIKDRFPPQKNVTAEEVREKYHIVKTHDRVGRMADTQEFQNFSFPRDRFSDELLDELRAVCPSAVIEEEDRIIIRHLYTERQMTPLNMYIDSCSEDELTNALDEYGNAIAQLAAANIFPGDMLLKNFGITRHGRVVFYDYDEISYLTEMNFRDIPEPQTEEQEMAAEPWYSIAPNDVFPEEFKKFLFGKPGIKQRFTDLHGRLFEASYWRELKDNITGGEVSDVFPYRRKKRFAREA